MDIIWIVIGGILILVGIVGCILPIIPGPPISFIGMLMLQLTVKAPFEERFLWIWALITAVVTVMDYVIPIYGTKKFGGTKRGMWGSTIGLFAGLFFFPPFGIIIGPFIGAFLGEMSTGKSDNKKALKSAFGSFLGFVAGTLLKFIACFMMGYYFFTNIF